MSDEIPLFEPVAPAERKALLARFRRKRWACLGVFLMLTLLLAPAALGLGVLYSSSPEPGLARLAFGLGLAAAIGSLGLVKLAGAPLRGRGAAWGSIVGGAWGFFLMAWAGGAMETPPDLFYPGPALFHVFFQVFLVFPVVGSLLAALIWRHTRTGTQPASRVTWRLAAGGIAFLSWGSYLPMLFEALDGFFAYPLAWEVVFYLLFLAGLSAGALHLVKKVLRCSDSGATAVFRANLLFVSVSNIVFYGFALLLVDEFAASAEESFSKATPGTGVFLLLVALVGAALLAGRMNRRGIW